jgi:hypothetical protein
MGFLVALVACADDEVYGRPIPASIRQQINGICDSLMEEQLAA